MNVMQLHVYMHFICPYLEASSQSLTPINPVYPPSSLHNLKSWLLHTHTHTHTLTGPSKAVVASTSTLIAILAILIAVVSLLMIVMGLYIPYRKYKTKFTETANFKFVDLSESTQWDRAKMKVQEFTDKLNRKRRSSKVGLVNEQNESSRLLNFPFESVS